VQSLSVAFDDGGAASEVAALPDAGALSLPPEAPRAVRGVEARPDGGGRGMVVSWQPPEDGPKPERYLIQARAGLRVWRGSGLGVQGLGAACRALAFSRSRGHRRNRLLSRPLAPPCSDPAPPPPRARPQVSDKATGRPLGVSYETPTLEFGFPLLPPDPIDIAITVGRAAPLLGPGGRALARPGFFGAGRVRCLPVPQSRPPPPTQTQNIETRPPSRRPSPQT
jgi:hypothetical protein